MLSAFYDLFVGMSSFSAGLIANAFGYPAAFLMAIIALAAAAIAGRLVFAAPRELAHEPEIQSAAVPAGDRASR